MSTTTADRLALLLRTKQWQRRELEKRYPSLDFDEIPFSAYRQLWMGRSYVPGLVGAWNAYGRSNSEDASTRDILHDYSGHGRDIQLYNFGWTEDSGYNTTTYPGALVSDGVDDYGQCVKSFALPDDYTVVAVRNIISGNNAAIASKGATVGAFLFDATSGGNRVSAWSYGGQNPLNNLPALFSYQTKTSYNGTAISFGAQEDSESDLLKLFTHNNSSCAQAALYDLRIYDHTLTAEELQIVRDEMMTDYENATGGGIANVHYVADWDGKGRSNDEDEPMRSTWTDKATGKVIDLHNYAYAGMSGWGGYGIDCSKVVVNGPQDLVEGNVLQVNAIANGANFLYGVSGMKSVSARIRVNGISRAVAAGVAHYLQLYFSSSGGEKLRITGDGVHEVDLPVAEGSQWMYLYVAPAISAPDWTPIDPVTVEILPSYPGALVSDGIDDYGVTQEAINEEVGTILLTVRHTHNTTGTGWYYFRCGLPNVPERIYAWFPATEISSIGYPPKDIELPTGFLTRAPLNPNNIFYICGLGTSAFGAFALYRLILIQEQLDDAQVEFLKWKVDKEYRDWCKANGYEYAINQLTA